MQHSSHHLLAEHITRQVLQALEDAPGNSFVGTLPVKHHIVPPAPKDTVRARMRAAIEKKFNKKYGNL